MLDLSKLKQIAFEIAQKRGQCLTGDALKHCAGEVCEAIIAREDWKIDIEASISEYVDNKHKYELELADIIICVLSECGQYDIDIEKAILEKIEINENRIKKQEC